MWALLPLLWVEGVWAVDCPSASYQLTTQADVSALGAANCDTVTGNLVIGSSTNIATIDPLVNVAKVGGELIIRGNSSLINIDGLVNLIEVTGRVLIDSNSLLTGLDGLGSLVSAGSLELYSNPSLSEINGLSSLSAVGGDLVIKKNAALKNIHGLSSLTNIQGDLTIDDNDELINIDGLSNVVQIVGNSAGYCASPASDRVLCSEGTNFDPWITNTGEAPFSIPAGRILSIPFTTGTAEDSEYGYLQLTTAERSRDPYNEPIFHAYFSDRPAGEPVDGVKCEWWGREARTNFFWTQQEQYSNQVCYLGASSKTLHLNFEVVCYPPSYSGTCTDEVRNTGPYQFDVSRRIRY